nr:chitobiase/beta-hexosaminidase C-terminal domain-containing protein [uncultured Desulfobacter sp.]
MNDLMECQKEESLNAIMIELFKAYWISYVILGVWLFLLPIPTMAANVNSSIQLVKGPVSYDAQTQTGIIEIKLKNIGTENLTYPIKVIVKKILYTLDAVELNGDSNVDGRDIVTFTKVTGTPDTIDLETFANAFGRTDFISPSVAEEPVFELTNASGYTPDGLPYLIYSVETPEQIVLGPNQETEPFAWTISIPVEAYQKARSFHVKISVFSGDDTLSPDIEITQPEESAELKENTPTVTISFNDEDSGINTSSFTAAANGVDIASDFTVSESGATAELSSALPYNDNTITVSIADNDGNIGTANVNFKVQPDTDSDNDGMPDWWELKFFGDLTTYQGTDDYDGDGISNAEEYNNDTDPTNSDTTPPQIRSQYPTEETTLIPTGSQPFEMMYYLTDDGSGIKSVTLLDENGVDITAQAVLTGYSLVFTINRPESRTYYFTLIIIDNAGNKTEKDIEFTLDCEPPTISVSSNDNEDGTVTVELTTEETATIYYSTDGYPPYKGTTNTSVYITALTISETTNLQFYAEDTAGNTSSTQSAIYYLDQILPTASSLSVSFDASNSWNHLSWEAVAQAAKYHIYRAVNAIDKKILEDCVNNKIAPPSQLRSGLATTNLYKNDPDILSETTYWYGITIENIDEVEGPLSELVEVKVGTDGFSTAQNIQEAILWAKAWLKANQDQSGSWGNEKNKILSTSQVLNAFKAAEDDDVSIRSGMFYLRGHYADNNDFLARQINTLNDFGQNVDYLVSKLILQAYISESNGTNYLFGWGTRPGYYPDPVSTAIGASALKKATQGTTLADQTVVGLIYDNNGFFFSLDDRKFGWSAGQEASVYVSSIIYRFLIGVYNGLPANFSYDWIITTQTNNNDGSFGNGLLDTAAALLWLDLSETQKANAAGYLKNRQNQNGSWVEDPFLTGLCLEALLK